MTAIEMKIIRPNLRRALFGLLGMLIAIFGAGLLWGPGGGLLVAGLLLYIDTASDQVLERLSGTTIGE